MTSATERAGVGLYQLDKRASRFTVRASASGMLSALGHNPTIAIRDFDGQALFDPGGKTATLRIEIRADSLEVTDDISSKDRKEIESAMKEKVLETAKYPAILFESSQASMDALAGDGRYKVTVNGSLSLHGITRSLPVTAQVTVIGTMLRAGGEFTVLQSDFGIAPVTVAGGALKLKDELRFSFDIVAREPE